MKYFDTKFLLYTAMADAYGMGCEYLKPETRPEDKLVVDEILKLERYVAHPGHGKWAPGPGQYTDDTEMCLANTNVLLSDKTKYTKLDFADAYVKEFAYGGQRKGYSKGFQAILETVNSGEELLKAVVPNSEKNGAAMRATPFGVMNNIHDLLDAATVSASVTHDTAIGHFSARAMALAKHFSLYVDEDMVEVRDWIRENLPSEDMKFRNILTHKWNGTPVVGNSLGPVGLTTVSAVLELITTHNDLLEMLHTACSWGGDTDSVSSLAWGIYSARTDQALPGFFEHCLEFGSPKTGSPRLLLLGEKLLSKYKRN